MKKDKKRKYIILEDGGCDFRQMAKIMTEEGYTMNHATARNNLMDAIESLFLKVSHNLNANITINDINKLKSEQDIHDSLGEVLYTAFTALTNEEQKKLIKGNK